MKSLVRRLASTGAVALVATAAFLSGPAFAENHMARSERHEAAAVAAGMPGTQSGVAPLVMPQQAAVPAKGQAAPMTPTAKPAMTNHWAATATEVFKVQEALVRDGIGVKVDGLMGPETRGALKYYQSENHLPVTGRIDPATLKSLNVS